MKHKKRRQYHAIQYLFPSSKYVCRASLLRTRVGHGFVQRQLIPRVLRQLLPILKPAVPHNGSFKHRPFNAAIFSCSLAALAIQVWASSIQRSSWLAMVGIVNSVFPCPPSFLLTVRLHIRNSCKLHVRNSCKHVRLRRGSFPGSTWKYSDGLEVRMWSGFPIFSQSWNRVRKPRVRITKSIS